MLSADNAQALMQRFVAEAHAQGLAVAQKNVAEWVQELCPSGSPRATSVGFDFAIIEEC